MFIGLHLVVSAAAASAFAWRFGQNPRSVVAHILLLAEWDMTLAAVTGALVGFCSHPAARWQGRAYHFLIAVTFTLQVDLYALNLVSNLSWGRNFSGQLVATFA